MRGNIRRRGTAWELRVYVGRDSLTGAKRYRTQTVHGGKRNAEKALAALVSASDGAQATQGGRTLGDLLDHWFDACSSDWSPGTAYQTRWLIDHRMAGLRDRPLRTIDTAQIDEFYRALRERGGRGGGPLSVSSVLRVHGVLRLALEQAVKWGWLTINPADLANPGKHRKPKITPPTVGEMLQLLEAAGGDDPELLTFLFLDAETGARRGELSALRVDDIGDDFVSITRSLTLGLRTPENQERYDGHIWVASWRRGQLPTVLIEKANPKNESSVRTISLSPPTIELVRTQIHRLSQRAGAAGGRYPDDGFMFPANIEGTRPLRPDTWTRRFSRLTRGLGLSVRLHDVRHFVATTLLTSGVDLATVAGRLGHGGGGKTTLALYSHFLHEPDRAASNLMMGVLTPTRTEPGADVIPFPSTGETRTE